MATDVVPDHHNPKIGIGLRLKKVC
jgi:hypothetical protein